VVRKTLLQISEDASHLLQSAGRWGSKQRKYEAKKDVQGFIWEEEHFRNPSNATIDLVVENSVVKKGDPRRVSRRLQAQAKRSEREQIGGDYFHNPCIRKMGGVQKRKRGAPPAVLTNFGEFR